MGKNGELGLKNPKGKGFCMILWLLSIEPPFYAAVNSAIESLDKSLVKTVGPFARALHEILFQAHTSDIKRSDSIKQGSEL